MARSLRIEYEGALYHVLRRGDRPEAIFLDDADRQEFLDALGQVCDKRFNRRHRLSGHLFQVRYKAQLTDERSDSYLCVACDYIRCGRDWLCLRRNWRPIPGAATERIGIPSNAHGGCGPIGSWGNMG